MSATITLDGSRLDRIVADVDFEEARALHRVVRALHDGHCPKCSAIFPAEQAQWRWSLGEKCPKCGFTISREEAEAALSEFAPIMQRNLELFEAWRERRRNGCSGQSGDHAPAV